MPAKFQIIAPLGENLDAIYVGMREFPTEKVFLVDHGKHAGKAEELSRELEKFRVEVQRVEVKGSLLEGMFRAFAEVKRSTEEARLLVNISSGEGIASCSALAAAFVNGIKAFHVDGDKVSMLPVMKFSYYRLIPKKKLEMIRFLKDQPDCCSSLEDLAKRTGMSLPLASYHVNGNAKVEGLITQGLAEAHVGPRGRTQVMLTELGRLIAEGYVEGPGSGTE